MDECDKCYEECLKWNRYDYCHLACEDVCLPEAFHAPLEPRR